MRKHHYIAVACVAVALAALTLFLLARRGGSPVRSSADATTSPNDRAAMSDRSSNRQRPVAIAPAQNAASNPALEGKTAFLATGLVSPPKLAPPGEASFRAKLNKDLEHKGAPRQVRFNEVLFWPKEGEHEWVELFNASDRAENVSGYELWNASKRIYRVPSGLPPMPPGAYLVVAFDGRGAAADQVPFQDKSSAILHADGTNVFLAKGDFCALYRSPGQGSGNLLDLVRWGMLPPEAANSERTHRLLDDADTSMPWANTREEMPVSRTRIGPQAIVSQGGSIGYYWDEKAQMRRMQIFSGSDASFGLANPVPSPQLHLPGDRLQAEQEAGAFSWIPMPGNDKYDFQICADPDGTQVFVSITDCQNTWCKPEQALKKGTYFWRVRAKDPRGVPSAWGRLREFTITRGGN